MTICRTAVCRLSSSSRHSGLTLKVPSLSAVPTIPNSSYASKKVQEQLVAADDESMVVGKKSLEVLRPPRAVTMEEAARIAPARESNKTTMMPWKGWFQTFLQEKVLSPESFQKFRNFFFFMPDDLYDLQQSPKLSQKVPISKTDPTITAMYRTPSPGSQAPVRIPTFEVASDTKEAEDPYDANYFKRDTRRRYLATGRANPAIEKIKLQLMDQSDPDVQAELANVGSPPPSSPGNKGRFATGPTDFDPTGLRSTMSVTWEALDKSLDQWMPDHLPEPTWAGKEEEIIAWHKQRDLPVPVGAYYTDLKVSRERRVAIW